MQKWSRMERSRLFYLENLPGRVRHPGRVVFGTSIDTENHAEIVSVTASIAAVGKKSLKVS